MKSVDFPQANLPLAKDQPEYNTLFVHYDMSNPMAPMTACMELSEAEIAEIAEIVKTKRLWITQSTFGKGYHPILMSVIGPYDGAPTDIKPAHENRTPAAEWDKTHFLSPGGGINLPCHNCSKHWKDHFWSERQCEL